LSGAGGGIRTPVAQRRQIYSLVVLATHPPLPDPYSIVAQERILMPVDKLNNRIMIFYIFGASGGS
tara:strand:- start:1716 stop:1913 length:198 start_codon:yes stop_codon:yes gene_type:complete